MRINKNQDLLIRELIEYEKVTAMTADENAALHSWVNSGYSVHENASMAVDDFGNTLDFLDVYREEKEVAEKLKNLPLNEQNKYILRLKGEHSVETLLEDRDALLFKINVYERILKRHQLLGEANELMDYWRKTAPIIPAVEETEELPFTGGSQA